jgi:putative nucleotidyltransferase with HDIG domain
VAIATTAVAVVPVVVVWWLRDAGIISSPWVSIGLAIALSLAASLLGNAYWQRCHGSGDVFFSELLLWGWLHRFRGERRLAKTAGLLGLSKPETDAPGEESLERRSRLLRQMAAALDAQDPYTDGHSRRVALHSAMVARKLGLERGEMAKIRTAAAVHDIGKLRVPSELLNKPGELSEEEFAIVKRHAEEGAEIVSCMEDPEITGMVRHHHERFDGAGYPAGLKGEDAPLGARIIAVADTFDALTSVRAYRTAIPHKRALDTILAASGSQLDPVVVRAFVRCYSANRAVLFWTLLAVSPQRALAWVRGKNPGRGNLANAMTSIATPAALATVVATAFGTAGSLATVHPPLRLAQRAAATGAAKSSRSNPRASHHSARATGPAAPRTVSTPPKQAVLGVRQTRTSLTPRLRAGGSRGAGSGSGGGSGTGPTSGSRGGSGKPSGSPPRKGKGGASTTPSTFTPPPSGSGPPLAVTVPTPTVSAPTAQTNGATPGAAGGGSTPSSSGGSTGGDPGSGSGSPAGGGGTGNGSAGGPSGSPGGNQGGPSGGGGSGQPEPTTKDDCKNGGYKRYGYANQGQCVSYVERQLHP